MWLNPIRVPAQPAPRGPLSVSEMLVPNDEPEQSAVLAERRFTGALSSGEESVEVVFHAHAGANGEVRIRFDPLPRSAATTALQTRWDHAGAKPALYRLS